MNWRYLAGLDFAVVWEFRAALLEGLWLTLVLYLLGGAISICGGVALAAAGRTGLRPVRWLVIAFVEAFRNTPLLVQLMWIHFALPTLTGVRMSVFQSALLALSLNASAYVSEIVRAGIGAVPGGQWEVSRALGLGRYAMWRCVILPQALRIVIPPLAGMMISLLKGTAVLSILSVAELMRATTRISTHGAAGRAVHEHGAPLPRGRRVNLPRVRGPRAARPAEYRLGCPTTGPW
jgi:His/Glu/Gln/Arg/opine family amino acid ABC transporter permease subunit